MRKAFATMLGVTTALCALTMSEKQSSASLIDVGGQVGYQQRNLANTKYKGAFAWHLHADLALLPPILMMGAYLEQSTATPDADPKIVTTKLESMTFRAIGARGKLKIPIPGPFTPYGIAGIGWVHSNAPDYVAHICAPPPAPAGTCTDQKLTNLEANFVEFLLGGGFNFEIAGPLVLTAEFLWRPTTGYSNDQYEKSLQGQIDSGGSASPSAPSPSKNGFSWTAMAGLAISF